ncbi:MAG: dienelactone hydrolase [Phenylobacterium sp.]|uniref:alpha/beta hydrolase family protein n=1 Tax=Phenylobacterium sp. TaxID=1871053 RepID=UPI0025EA2D8F|nr:dienelactone hydrolase [Phenylobacterium sp.]MBI1197267.1 dienelactone hydrolase [Phenylobacterium sp.]
MRLVAAMAAAWAVCGGAQAASVGFATLSVPVAGDRPLTLGVWYPTDAPETVQPLLLSRQSVAAGAPVRGEGLPLVVMSHGTGGSFADHYDTAHALAEAGFVVAAPSHTGDTYDDHSRALRIGERAPAIVRVIDYMTAEWPDHARIDAGRIGMFGFSSGGFTALVAIGGRPDLGLIGPHCAEHPTYFDCQLKGGEPSTAMSAGGYDPRIRAAVIAAPALGFTFAPHGLDEVKVPVQLWRAGADRILPHPLYAEAVRGLLPTPPDYRVVEGADHFDFLPPCSPALAQAAPQICGDGIFDRAGFHARFNAEVVAFLQRTLR